MQICGIVKLVQREGSKQQASLQFPSVCSELPTAEKPWRLSCEAESHLNLVQNSLLRVTESKSDEQVYRNFRTVCLGHKNIIKTRIWLSKHHLLMSYR